MFEGLLSPWHLLIVLVVVFVVIGPRKLTSMVRGTAESVQRLVDPDESPEAPQSSAEVDVPTKLSYRIGRRFRRHRK